MDPHRPDTRDPDLYRLAESDLSLLETLDHVLNRGLVITGEITISVANIDLIFLGVNLLLASTETILEVLGRRAPAAEPEKAVTSGP